MFTHEKKLLCLALAAALATPCLSQTVPAAGTTAQTSTSSIPISHLYQHFLLFEAHFEQMEQQHPGKAGRKGGFIDTIRKKTGLSADEWKAVSASSIRFQANHRSFQSQIKRLVASDRLVCQSQSCPTPPSLAQVIELEHQDRQALSAEITSLETSLGPDSTAKLHVYLQSMAVHIKTLTPEQIKAAQQSTTVVTK